MQGAYDNLVIGSGFGGAISAFRLAEAGQSVALLEQGRRFAKQDFPRSVGQVGRAFFQPKDPRGFLEYRAFKNIDVIQGVGVGGGSLHYFNVNLPAPARVLDRWPKPLGRACLDRYYGLVLERLDSRPFSPPAGRRLPPRTEAFLAAARAADARPVLAEIAVYSGPDRLNASGVAQSACTYCGNCMLGCHVQAKNTLDITYIAAAERDHGLALFSEHKVHAIRPALDRGEGYYVPPQPARPGPGRNQGLLCTTGGGCRWHARYERALTALSRPGEDLAQAQPPPGARLLRQRRFPVCRRLQHQASGRSRVRAQHHGDRRLLDRRTQHSHRRSRAARSAILVPRGRPAAERGAGFWAPCAPRGVTCSAACASARRAAG